MEILERGPELHSLTAALDRAQQRQGSVVLVAGEAGIGKTTLLREFCARIGDKAEIWLGGCDDLITPRPLGPFREMPTGAAEEPDRDSMIDVVLDRVGTRAQPVVIVVDDAQWADDASLDVLRYLGRRADQLPMVLCIVHRSDGLGADHPLQRVIGDLTGTSVERISLTRLSRDAVAAIAHTAGVDPDPVFESTGGNPFLVAETIRSPSAPVPHPVRDAIGARLETVGSQARTVLEYLSQMPGGASWDLLSGLVDGLADALAEAEDEGLVEFDREAFRFRHELVRRAVDLSLSDGQRLAINRWLLEHAETHGEDTHTLLHHAGRAAAWDSIAHHAPAAVEASARAGAHFDTLRLAMTALEHEELLEPEIAASLHDSAAYAAYLLNRFNDAAAAADQAVERWQRLGRAEPLGNALVAASRMHTMTGEPHIARASATRGVEVLESIGPGRALAFAYSTMANLDAIAGRLPEAIEWSTRAIEMARAFDADDVLVHAHAYRGLSRIGLGEDGGFADLQGSVVMAENLGHHEYLFRTAMNLGVTLIWAGRFGEARPMVERATEVARDADIRFAVFHGTAQRCHIDLFEGHWDRAADDLERLLANEDDDPVGVLVLPLSLAGRLRLRRGEEADDLIERAWRIAIESGQDFRIATAGLARIEQAWHRSDEDVVTVGHELLTSIGSTSIPYFEGEIRRYLRRAGIEVDQPDRLPPALAAGIDGEWAKAGRMWAEQGATYHRALELIEADDRETAFEGLGLLDELGAAGTSARVRQILRGRGWTGIPRGPQGPTREHPVGLTPRQVDVLIHLTEGKTSVEIGQALFVSSRTVDNHVAEIVRKLDATDRRDAVAKAIDKGIVDHHSADI